MGGYPVTGISYAAFTDCESLTGISIPDSVTYINEFPLYSCTSLNSITVDEDNQVYYSKGNCIIGRETNTLVLGCKNSVIPEGVTSIGVGAFYKCYNLTSVQIPSSVISIDDWAFEYCKSLTSVQIPNSVTSIGEGAFESCTSLASVQLPNSVTSIGYSAFYDTDYYNNADNWENEVLYIGNYLITANNALLDSYNIKEGTTTIADYAFESCGSLTNITFPASVIGIGEGAFLYCTSFERIMVDKENEAYYSKDNCLIERETNTLILGCKNSVIPEEVTSIGEGAFYGCYGLTSITIPNSVISIGEDAFRACAELTSVILPDSITSIGYGVFYYCYSLTSINIPTSVISIGDEAFCGCESLESMIIPNSVTSIGDYAFGGCYSHTSINIPSSVTSIGDYAFGGCDNLTIYGVSGSYAQQYADENGIPFISTNTSTTLFPDTDKNGWYYDAVEYVAESGIMKGYANGNFGTADGIQRQDFLVMLARFDGVNLDEYDYDSQFHDVSANSYYEAAVNWGYENGIVTGYQNGNFGVSDMINREQIVTFLYRYSQYKGLNTTVSSTSAQSIKGKYPDYNVVSDYAQNAVLWAVDRGVISGKNGNEIAPFAGAQRCEVAQIMFNINKNKIF